MQHSKKSVWKLRKGLQKKYCSGACILI
jgi:hypothetical protein